MNDLLQLLLYQVVSSLGNGEDFDDAFLLYLIAVTSSTTTTLTSELEETFVFSRNRHVFHRNLPLHLRRYRSGCIPCPALQPPSDSAWNYLYHSGNNQALITCTGFDFPTFNFMLDLFQPLYDQLSPHHVSGKIVKKKRNGRPRSLDAMSCLGLVLTWTRMRGSVCHMNMIFGIIVSTSSVFLRFGRRVLCHVLSKQKNAQVHLPEDPTKVEQYVGAIGNKHNYLGRERVAFSIDGVKLYIEQAGSEQIQNMFYNGWTHDHYVGNVFVFGPDGCIVAMVLNAPGAMHDSGIATYGNLYEKMEYMFDTFGVKSCVDSAFMAVKKAHMIQSGQQIPLVVDGDHHKVRLNREATQFRQSAEWGMRTLQALFPRLKDRIIYEEVGERLVILKVMTQLFNLRANCVGISQIRNTYMPYLTLDPVKLMNRS